MNLSTNPNLLVLQAALMSPNYQGPGRWTIFIPENRKSFLAIGKDELPNIIKILMFFSNANSNIGDLNKIGIFLSEEEKNTLIDNKLLLNGGVEVPLRHSFLQIYQLAAF